MKATGTFALGVALLGAGLAWDLGGREDPPGVPPLPPPTGAASAPVRIGSGGAAARPSSDDLVTVERLARSLDHASLEVPNLRAAEALAAAKNWRRMPTPWLDVSGFSGPARGVASTIALPQNEVEAKAVALPTGGVWQPDAHTWNMNEGAYLSKDALFAPTPATMTFPLTLPAHARLLVSTGLSTPASVPVRFTVTARDAAGGAGTTLFEETRAPADQTAWHEAAIDLSAVAERPIELSLRTQALPREARAGKVSVAPSTALALWGDPQIQAPAASAPVHPPYNVLWIVVDALRPDVLATMHDEAEERALAAARYPIGDALLPRMPGLLPNLEALAARGARFTHAYSAATWTRPGTLGMLAGARPSELGTQTLSWLVSDPEATRYYATDRPLFPHLAATHGFDVRGFVNNYFMSGYAPVGLDMGFPALDDHRYPTRDTREIERDAETFLAAHAGERFFAFCNFTSPHEPYEPPPEMEARVPPAPAGPADPTIRRYVAEAAKDDAAIGQLLAALAAARIDDRTIVVVTADHGETLSTAHSGTSELDHQAIRFHHSASNYEETVHVPLLVVLPGVIPPGTVVKARVRNTDIAPTLLDLEGQGALARTSGMSGASLMPLVRGEHEADERPVVTEGRGSRGFLWSHWRLVTREGSTRITHYGDHDVTVNEELFDLADDPGERHDVSREHPDVVAEMRARLTAAMANAPVAGSQASTEAASRQDKVEAAQRGLYRFRFVGAGAAHRISGAIHVRLAGDAAGSEPPTVTAVPVGVDPEALHVDGADLEISLSTAPDASLGFDVQVHPEGAVVTWDLFEDDRPWPADQAFAGPFGLRSPAALHGGAAITGFAAAEPAFVDPSRDRGLFVTSVATEAGEGGGQHEAPVRPSDPRANREMSHLLEQWGYARGTAAAAK
jgi:arylsulfatase A